MPGGTAPRRAGDDFERAVADYLRAHGYPYAERAYGAGRPDDHGDIDGLPGWVVQCRAERALEVGTALAAAERQTRDHLERAVAICKRRSHSTGEAYVVMTLATFAEIAGEALQSPSVPAGRPDASEAV